MKKKVLLAFFVLLAGITVVNQMPAQAAQTQPTKKELKKQVDQMTLEEEIGQMYAVPSNGDPQVMKQAIKQYHLGGLILFARDLAQQKRPEFQQKIAAYQTAAQIPLLIGTDQEGGSVSRLSVNPNLTGGQSFPAPKTIYDQYGFNGSEDLSRKTAQALHQLGINWNFSPVVDVTSDHKSFIFDRTLGQNYDQTANYAVRVVRGMQSAKVAATLKHFPGYGSAADTHTGLATTKRPLSQFQHDDFLPFRAGIRMGVDSIMVAHIIATNIDDKYPASLSPAAHQILRKELDFKKVIVSDDLGMGAIKEFARQQKISADVQAVKAGNDIIMSRNYATGIPVIAKAVHQGEIPRSQIDQSVYRILKMKRELGLLHQ